ncbi:TPA: lipopolysaccharide biosynthesis protein [Serratia fonticola]
MNLKILKLFSGEFSLLVFRLLTILIVAKTYNVYTVGLFSTLMTWASILSLASVFGGYNLIQKNHSNGYYNKVIKISSLNSCLFSFSLSMLIASLFFRENILFAFSILFFETLTLSLRSISKAFLYAEGLLTVLNRSNIWIGISYILIQMIFLLIPVKTEGMLILFVITYNLFSCAFFAKLIYVRFKKESITLSDMIGYYRNAATFFISSSLRNSYAQIDKVMVNIIFGSAVSGIYNICSRFATTAMLPLSLYIQSIEKNFYKDKVDGMHVISYFNKKRVAMLIISIVLALASVLPAYVVSTFISFGSEVINMYVKFIPLIITQSLANAYYSLLNGRNMQKLRVSVLISINIILVGSFFVFKNVTYTPYIISVINVATIIFISRNVNEK